LEAQGLSLDAQGLSLEAQGLSLEAQGLVSVAAPGSEFSFVPAAQGLPQAVTIPMPKMEAVARVIRYLTFMEALLLARQCHQSEFYSPLSPIKLSVG
jgi:hypothetical protein